MNKPAIEVTGSASIPSWYGFAWAGYSWAALIANDDGVLIRFKSRALSLLFGFGAPQVDGYVAWSIDWAKIRTVEVGARSVRFVPVKGRTCRFSSMSRPELRLVEELLHRHGVTTRHVSTTLLMLKPLTSFSGAR